MSPSNKFCFGIHQFVNKLKLIKRKYKTIVPTKCMKMKLPMLMNTKCIGPLLSIFLWKNSELIVNTRTMDANKQIFITSFAKFCSNIIFEPNFIEKKNHESQPCDLYAKFCVTKTRSLCYQTFLRRKSS